MDPPPLMALTSIHFLPHFFFAIESYKYETDVILGLKILLLSPIMVGSKLAFSGCREKIEKTLMARYTALPFMANAIKNFHFVF